MTNTILIIDDNAPIRQQIRETLQGTDLFQHYLEAGNGIEGFKMLLSNRVDLVLCDVEMPGMDGFKLLSMVNSREELRDIPVLLLTSHEGVTSKVRGLEQGACDYVTKPFVAEELLARVRIHLKIKTLQDHLKESNRRLQQLSQTDPLTELNNRRHLMEALDTEFERSRRTGDPLALVMIDLDHFKRVNDTYGHQQGDDVLRAAARAIKEQLRQYDSAARFGGEEFALLLPETNDNEAFRVAERLRHCLEELRYSGPIADLNMTASFGVASTPHADIASVEDLIRVADDALYRAKANGRNRVEPQPALSPVRLNG